jgi:hypothetical protein
MGDEDNAKLVLHVLQGVYECEAETETMAKDGPNIRGNKWNNFHDHCFGGGCFEQGLIKDFLLITKPTLLKSKILSIWNYALSHKDLVPKEIYNISKEQFGIYEAACKKEKESKVNDVVVAAQLKEDMVAVG